jgi:Carboxypeptidase regulatory-like domain/TonB dependent receptor
MRANGATWSATLAVIFCLFATVTVCAQRSTSLRGHVTDQLGAVIVGVTITLTDANGQKQTAQTDSNGVYHFDSLAVGAYDLRATQKGFAPFTETGVNVARGVNDHNIQLAITIDEQKVTVGDARTLDIDPNANKSARVISGNELNALSDDPNELAAQLDALAGPAAGPSGTQVFVDGFTASGPLPDKQTIREIVINQNPFSAEFERIGFGNIQIFTKPGTGKLHGGGAFTFNDAIFNSRNPYALNRPPYERRVLESNLSGPLSKRVSFFFNFGYRAQDDVAAINATTLDAGLNPQTVSDGVVEPKRFMNGGPRLDFALNKNNTLTVRYIANFQDLKKLGIGGFSLTSRAFDFTDHLHILQVVDMAILNPRMINEFGFQYIWDFQTQKPADPSSGIVVIDAFSGGGAQIGNASFKRHEDEFRDYVTMTLRAHTVKFGARYRWAHISDISPTNFGGTFIFTSLDQYRRTLLHTATPSQLIVAGGNPFAEVRQWDIGPFIQDDWKMRPDFTLSAGLRYQYQTNLKSNLMFAPRLSFAWTPWLTPKGQPKTVIRGGAGVFYDLVRTSTTLQANRFDGHTELQYIVTAPALLSLFPAVPSSAALTALSQPQTIWVKTTDMTEPYYLQTSFSLERTLPRNSTLSISYVGTRGLHQLRARNLNAPAPVTGVRPFGNSVNVYDYETTGLFNQHLLVVNAQLRPSRRINLTANYTLGKANGDTDGVGSFPADSYNLRNEYSRSTFDVRHRFTLTGTIETFWGIGFFPLVIAQTGSPFNIITGLDTNSDSLFVDRPAFATDLTRASVRRTAFGNFDLLPLPGATIIPRNFGNGPGYFSFHMRFQKTFGFGSVHAPARAQSAPGPTRGAASANGAASRPAQASRPEDKPYKLIISLAVANLFNRTNPGTPIGNLSSPLFGLSNSLSLIGQAGFGANTSSNRSVTLRAQFTF